MLASSAKNKGKTSICQQREGSAVYAPDRMKRCVLKRFILAQNQAVS